MAAIRKVGMIAGISCGRYRNWGNSYGFQYSLSLRGLVVKLCQSHLTGVWQTQRSITLKVLEAAWGGLSWVNHQGWFWKTKIINIALSFITPGVWARFRHRCQDCFPLPSPSWCFLFQQFQLYLFCHHLLFLPSFSSRRVKCKQDRTFL